MRIHALTNRLCWLALALSVVACPESGPSEDTLSTKDDVSLDASEDALSAETVTDSGAETLGDTVDATETDTAGDTVGDATETLQEVTDVIAPDTADAIETDTLGDATNELPTDAVSDATDDGTAETDLDATGTDAGADTDAGTDTDADSTDGSETLADLDIEQGPTCTEASDCAPLEDGDLCNGTLLCVDGNCEVDPTTLVTCAPTNCQASSVCEPTSGACVAVSLDDGTACDDANACTTGDVCSAGLCAPGAPLDCDDGSSCTTDSCDSALGCVNTTLSCDDDDPCTTDNCDLFSGCVFDPIADGGGCEDGDLCTTGETCTAGICGDSTPVVCDDGNPCTTESCEPTLGCIATDDLAATCDDQNACTQTACQAKTLSATTCEELGWGVDLGDPSVCGESEVPQCSGEVDFVTAQAMCGDLGARLCTLVELANDEAANSGCGYDAQLTWSSSPCDGASQFVRIGGTNNGDATECRPIDDGLAVVRCCADTAAASGSATCEATGLSCSGSTGCSTLSCDPTSGCTVNEQPLSDCDDGVECTIDSCDALTGCAHTPFNPACNDGDPCTVDTCTRTGCVFAPACDDSIECTTNLCDADTGACSFAPDDAACDDGQPCTTDVCVDGVGCTYAPDDALCDDGNFCTVETCTPFQGCAVTVDDSICDDGNPCTTDSCNSASGTCLALPTAGAPCTTDTGCSVGTCGTPDVSVEDCTGFDAAASGSEAVCAAYPSDASGEGCGSDLAAAALACAATGARLCTLGEFLGGEVPEGTLCEQSNGYVWTATPCDADSRWAFPLAPAVPGLTAKCVPNIQDNVAQACCFDADPTTATGQIACVAEETPCAGDGIACTQVTCDQGCVAEDESTPTCCDPQAAECNNVACLECVAAADDFCLDTFDEFCVDCALGGSGYQGACDATDCTAECGCDLGCDDADACTNDSCSPTTGCIQAPADAAICGCGTDADCDDGEPCTVDVCDTFLGCQNYQDPGCPEDF